MDPDKKISGNFFIQQLANDDEQAFDHLFRQYYKPLCGYVVRMVGNGNETENIVQDCFLRFWENRDKIQQINNLSAYLFFMARNLAIDHLRPRKITNKPLYPTIALETDETEQQVSFRELDERLWQAIAQLPERCRIAFEYSRINGLSHQQIAEKMQITVKGVEALIGRSIKILREELADFLVVASFFLTTF